MATAHSSSVFRLKYLIVVILLLSGSVVVYLESQKQTGELQHGLRDIALFLGPFALFSLLWEIWLVSDRHQDLARVVTGVMKDEFSDVAAIHAAGVARVRKSVSNEDLRDFLATAQSRIRVMVTWFVDPTALKEVLAKKAKEPRLSIQIILLRHDSKYLERRGLVVQPGQKDYGPQENRRTVIALQEAFDGADPNRVQVLVYDSLPSAFLVEVDDVAWIGFHLNSGVALRNPHLEIRREVDGKETLLGAMVREELDKVAGTADVIDLASAKQLPEGKFHYKLRK